MELSVYKVNGSSSGSKVKLPSHVFGIEPNEHAVYLSIKAIQANSRQGTASSKNRSAVRGGGKKPWKQKGRGVARAGTIRSPLWVGGGRIFGPLPRNYRTNLPQKIKTLARLSVYSDKFKNDKIRLIEDFKLKNPKTKEIFSILKALGLQDKKTLLLLNEYDQDVWRAGRNIPNLIIKVANTESTYDLLNCEVILLQQSAVNKLSGVFKK